MGLVDTVNDFSIERLKPFDLKTAKQFIEAIFASRKVKIDPEMRDIILELVGAPIPYLLAVLLTAILDRLRMKHTQVTIDIVKSAFEDDLLGGATSAVFHHPLIKSLEDEANDVRGSAATALGRIGSEEAIHPLIKSLEDEANNMRGSAATALGRIGSERAIEPLIHCLKDNVGNVRISAALALGRIAFEKPIPDMTRLISILIKDKDIVALPENQIIFFVQNLMRSSFWTGNLKVIHKVIRELSPLISNADALYAPYMAAYEYLHSKRDPAILERQQPEMREAIQLLVDNFDQGYT